MTEDMIEETIEELLDELEQASDFIIFSTTDDDIEKTFKSIIEEIQFIKKYKKKQGYYPINKLEEFKDMLPDDENKCWNYVYNNFKNVKYIFKQFISEYDLMLKKKYDNDFSTKYHEKLKAIRRKDGRLQ